MFAFVVSRDFVDARKKKKILLKSYKFHFRFFHSIAAEER